MKRLSPEFKIGILTLLALLVLGFGTLFVGKFHLFTKTYPLQVRFDFVSGLQTGAPVHLNGVKVGTVKSITIHPDSVPPVFVDIELTQKARLHQNCRAFINTMGLMGEKYVEIYAGTADSPFNEVGAPIIGQSPTEIQEILNASKSVADNLAKTMEAIADVFAVESTKMSLKNTILRMDSISRNIDELVAGRRGDTESFIRNLRILSENMNRTVLEVDSLLKENRTDTRVIVANLAQTSKDMREHTGAIMTNLDKLTYELGTTATEGRPDLTTTLKNFRDASADFKTTMKRLDNIAAKIEKGEGNVGKLVHDDNLYNQTTSTVSAIKEVALSLSSANRALSKTQYEYDLRYRGHLDRLRNDIHIRYAPSDEKYYMIGASDIGQKAGLDLMYYRRLGKLDVKLGVLESKAAAGFDYNLIPNQWSVGVTGVGLTDTHPRVDIQTNYKMFNYLDVDWYGIAGAEIQNKEAEVNAGMMIRY